MTHRTRTTTLLACSIAALGVAALSLAQPEGAPDRPGADGAQQQDLGAMLIQGLLASPGCLGVDSGQMRSGKNSIFAWFENKAAVDRWYYSDAHQGAMRAFATPDPDVPPHRPLKHVTDDETPIMVIATITFADKPHFEAVSLPISQISIELFAPLPGGAFLGGRLAPDDFNVPHMNRLD